MCAHLCDWFVAAAARGAACVHLPVSAAKAEGGVCDGTIINTRLQLYLLVAAGDQPAAINLGQS